MQITRKVTPGQRGAQSLPGQSGAKLPLRALSFRPAKAATLPDRQTHSRRSSRALTGSPFAGR